MLSCSADGFICHWINTNKDVWDYKSWKLYKKYMDPKDSSGINYLVNLYITKQESYFSTFSTNGNLNIYNFNSEKNAFEIYSNINYKKKLQDVISLFVLDREYLMILSGGYDNLINVHTIKRSILNNDAHIEYKLSLQGHMNSIRDISFAPLAETYMSKDFLFASSSQDSYIRLWRISKISKEEIDKLAENMKKINDSSSIYEEYKTKMSYIFNTKEQEYYNIVLDSILSGHEESVSSIRWGIMNEKNVLLSSSFDFTLSLWKWENNMVKLIN